MDSNGGDSSKRVIGLGLVGVGLVIAAARLSGFNAGENFWPLFIIAPGVSLLAYSLSAKNAGKWMTMFGMTVTMIGLILAYQNMFNHFESWAYAWSLIAPTGAGIGLMMYGNKNNKAKLVSKGRKMVNTGALMFLIGAFFFEMVLNISGRGMPELFSDSLKLPIILVGVGAAVFFWPGRVRDLEEAEG